MGNTTDIEARLAGLEARVTELTAQVKLLEDDQAIRSLLARYGYMADNCDDEGFVELYTEDATLIASNDRAADGTIPEGGGWHGHDGIRAFITNPKGHHIPMLLGKSMHLHGNNLVTYIDGDEAVAGSYGVSLVTGDGVTRVLAAHNNQWQFRRVDGTWRIKERRSAGLGDPWFATNLDATPN